MLLKRRSLLATVAIAPLVGCSMFKPVPVTDFLGEAASAFTAGNAILTALTVLVQTHVVAQSTARGWQTYVTAVDAQFATLHGNIDSGVTIQQAMVDAALTALNSLQIASRPAVTVISQPQADRAYQVHRAYLLKHAKFVPIAAILAWVLANSDILISAGGAIASLIQQIIREFSSVPAGTTTVAQADQAYQGFADALAHYNAALV